MQLFEYSIFWVPTEQQKKDGRKAEILVPTATILTASKEAAQTIASRAIPDAYIDQLDQVTICVRPF
jgi:hypothetical protein